MGTALRCPNVAPKCEEALHPSDVRKALGDEATAWAKYEQFAFSRFVETHAQDGVACCPTPGCPYVFEWDPANRKFACEVRGQACCRAPRRQTWRQAGWRRSCPTCLRSAARPTAWCVRCPGTEACAVRTCPRATRRPQTPASPNSWLGLGSSSAQPATSGCAPESLPADPPAEKALPRLAGSCHHAARRALVALCRQVQKVTGCNFIQCRCGEGFCYACGASAKKCRCADPTARQHAVPPAAAGARHGRR